MSGYSLVPFGLRVADKQLVDVSEVERGTKCECECPSCKTPLIARQGDINEWHFAHQSQSSFERTKKECDYSYYVSVRLMIKQLAEKGLQLLTPVYEDTFTIEAGNERNPVSTHFIIAKPKLLSVCNAEIEASFSGHQVDFIFKIEDFSVLVFICYEGRGFPFLQSDFVGQKCGVIQIDLSDMPNLFITAKNSKESYIEVLKGYLATGIKGKQWFYHPRYEKALATAQANAALELKRQRNKYPDIFIRHNGQSNKKFTPNQTKYKAVTCTCIVCRSTWQGKQPGENTCETCGTHLYVTIA